ncbi:MAG: hypothetical protein Roseis2KO_53120 [Roseivirga sp.]
MKKTLLSLGVILAVAIACQVNEPDTSPDLLEETSSSADLEDIYLVVEEPATFPGGNSAWKTFIEENLIVPESDPQGRVFATVVIDKQGAVHDIQLIRGIGQGADEAVVELLKKSPAWLAAKQKGKVVNSRLALTIQFGEAEANLMPKEPATPIDYAEFDEVFTVVEEQPTFPGGSEAWRQFINDNLKTPDSNVKGRVFASFVVDKDGAVHNIQLIRGIGGGADEAVVALLKNSPNWIAGKQRGREVNSRMQVVITFK